MNLNNFLCSGFTFTDDEYEVRLSYLLFNSILGVISLLLFALSSMRLFQGFETQAYVDFFFAFVSLYSIFYIRKEKSHIKKVIPLLLLAFFALICLAFYTQANFIGSSWFIALLLPAFYLSGYKYGIALTLASILSIFLLSLFSKLDYVLFNYIYMTLPLVTSSLFILIYEKRTAFIRKQLVLKNSALKVEIEQKEKLLMQAHYDHLTKLPNRVLFRDRLHHAALKADRSSKDFAVLFIDLDGFKKINDTLGHDAGDMVLVEIASRFQSVLRGEDTIARFGGDEFTCIIESLENCHNASQIAQKLLEKAKEPLMIPQMVQLSCSIGISIYKQDTDNEKILLQYADTAMYSAKDSGKDRWKFYTDC